MKKLTLCILLTFFLLSSPHAQEGMNWDAKTSIGFGFTPGWFIPDFTDLNREMKNMRLEDLPSSGFFATGITGFVTLPMIPNLRIGGMGLGGSVSRKLENGGVKNEVEYSVSMGGVSFEYILPFISEVGLSVGAVLGSGSTTIKIFRNRNDFSWDNIWQETSDTAANIGNVSREIKNSHFSITPVLNIDIPVYRFFAFRIGGGYQFAIGNKWKADNDRTISGVPSGLKGSTFFIQTGIFIGYFNY